MKIALSLKFLLYEHLEVSLCKVVLSFWRRINLHLKEINSLILKIWLIHPGHLACCEFPNLSQKAQKQLL